MITILEIFEKQSKIKLIPLTKEYYYHQIDKNLRKDIEATTGVMRPNSISFIITYDNNIIAYSGCIVFPKNKNLGYFQIYILKEYRGQNLLCTIAELIFKKLKLERMYSTVYKSNIPSIKSHMKSKCFQLIPIKEKEELIQSGFLKDDDERFEYKS